MKIDYKKNKITIISVVASLVIISLLVFLIIPFFNSITEKSKNIYDNRIQLAIYQKQRQNIEKTRIEYNDIKNDTENISKIFINKEQILEYINLFEKIAELNNVTQNIALDNNKSANDSDTLITSISVVGNWEKIIAYLKDIEMLDFYVNIDDLVFQKSGDIISLNFTANSFYP